MSFLIPAVKHFMEKSNSKKAANNQLQKSSFEDEFQEFLASYKELEELKSGRVRSTRILLLPEIYREAAEAQVTALAKVKADAVTKILEDTFFRSIRMG